MAGPSQVPTRICVVPGWLTNRASLANVVLGEEVLCNYLAIDSFDEFSGPDQVAARKTSRFLQGVFFLCEDEAKQFQANRKMGTHFATAFFSQRHQQSEHDRQFILASGESYACLVEQSL